MKSENSNKKIIAEVEIRLGLKVYKMEINSQFRWLWILGILLLRWLYSYYIE